MRLVARFLLVALLSTLTRALSYASLKRVQANFHPNSAAFHAENRLSTIASLVSRPNGRQHLSALSRKHLPFWRLLSSPSFPDRVDGDNDDDDLGDVNVNSFQSELAKRQQEQQDNNIELELEFDGYMLRDVLVNKWGACWDVEFQKFDTLGQRKLYLNVLPFQLGRRPFRHATEYDYLCHLQAVVEILVKYNQLDQILYQIQETNKKPRPGTSPLVAVPLRLELSQEQVDRIMGYLE